MAVFTEEVFGGSEDLKCLSKNIEEICNGLICFCITATRIKAKERRMLALIGLYTHSCDSWLSLTMALPYMSSDFVSGLMHFFTLPSAFHFRLTFPSRLTLSLPTCLPLRAQSKQSLCFFHSRMWCDILFLFFVLLTCFLCVVCNKSLRLLFN